jgi:hypothetical protein
VDGQRSWVENVRWAGPNLPLPRLASKRRTRTWGTRHRIKELTAARNQRRKDLFIAQDEVEARREALIADIEGKLKQKQELTQLFAIRWRLE